MDHSVHNKLVSFIWSIADDCLRDVYVRGKYRDVILPMVVLRRLDTLLEPTKQAVLDDVHFQQQEMNAVELDEEPLKAASGYVFYNISKWTLNSLFNAATNNSRSCWKTSMNTSMASAITSKRSSAALISRRRSAIWPTNRYCWMWSRNLSPPIST